ncbi:hypothetical protein BUALT_Bualt15G0120200 [Buddleja alternifolia]|uniref:Transmembrane protein n=1 Tax=Buddleja alternifolia TaxID=168488 RepID=A0AAV6WG17_9LAMI|nr:hypothetical protein BUALT_Bualt15G0120200 [Buddleja alternifolia]
MVPLLNQGAGSGGGGGALLSSTHQCSLKFAHPIPHLFSKRRRNCSIPRRRRLLLKPLTLANASDSTTTKPTSTSVPLDGDGDGSNSISLVGQENVPLEGVIQFEKPNFTSLLAKWGLVGVLAGGDVAALLLFSAIGRFSHGFSVFDLETFKTADPFIAGWFLSAYFLGGFGEEGRGKNGLWRAVTAAAKSWSLGIPLGLVIRAVTIGHTPPTNFILVTMGSTAVLVIGWRALLFSIFPSDKGKKNDVYKRGSAFELFELLTSLVRRW